VSLHGESSEERSALSSPSGRPIPAGTGRVLGLWCGGEAEGGGGGRRRLGF
jgi:hypothetical protein